MKGLLGKGAAEVVPTVTGSAISQVVVALAVLVVLASTLDTRGLRVTASTEDWLLEEADITAQR